MLFLVTKPLPSPVMYAMVAVTKMLCLRLSPRKKQGISSAEVSQTRLMWKVSPLLQRPCPPALVFLMRPSARTSFVPETSPGLVTALGYCLPRGPVSGQKVVTEPTNLCRNLVVP